MDIMKENIEKKWTIRKTQFIRAYSFHWHPRAEICCIADGECNFYVNGRLYKGKQGDVLVFNSGDIHRYMSDGNVADIYVCTFDPSLVYKNFERIPLVKVHISSEEMHEKGIFTDVLSLFEEILKEREEGKKHFEIIAQTQIVKLYSLLARHFEDESRTSTNDVHKFEAFQKILDYISKNYASDISLSDLARVINYSESNVSAMFSRFIGTNFKKYLDSIRVNKAIELLKNDTLNFTDVAMRCGFNNVRTFNSVFKSVTGMTPSEMKNKI